VLNAGRAIQLLAPIFVIVAALLLVASAKAGPPRHRHVVGVQHYCRSPVGFVHPERRPDTLGWSLGRTEWEC
jgi:hypothetical protein